MSHHYYLDNKGIKDGPYDLVTMMRRIRSGKIEPGTLVYVEENSSPIPASQIQDLALFFNLKQDKGESSRPNFSRISLQHLLKEGWRFTADYNVMTVFSGGIILLAVLLASGLIQTQGIMVGGTLAWIVLVVFHYLFLVCSLRLYRGQSFSSVFLNQQLYPILPVLIFSAIIFAVMIVGGFLLLVIPALIVAVYYIFVPFLIMDRRLNLVEAMYASRLLVQKNQRRYQTTIALLVLMYLACLILVFPVPVALPIFAGALCKMYEELSSS